MNSESKISCNLGFSLHLEGVALYANKTPEWIEQTLDT